MFSNFFHCSTEKGTKQASKCQGKQGNTWWLNHCCFFVLRRILIRGFQRCVHKELIVNVLYRCNVCILGLIVKGISASLSLQLPLFFAFTTLFQCLTIFFDLVINNDFNLIIVTLLLVDYVFLFLVVNLSLTMLNTTVFKSLKVCGRYDGPINAESSKRIHTGRSYSDDRFVGQASFKRP